MLSGERLTKIKQLPDLLICGPKFGPVCQKAAQRKVKQLWAVHKTKFENARKVRGIYFIDPDDGRFKETSFFKKKKNAQKTFEIPMEAAMPCELKKTKSSYHGSNKIPKSNCACIVEVTSPREGVWTGLYQKIMKITVRKGSSTRWVITIFSTSSLPCPKRWKFRMRKQRWIQNGRSSIDYQLDKWPK